MELKALPGRPRDWDERIRPFPTKTLFHESAWLDHVTAIAPGGSIDYFAVTEGERTLGYFCALRVRKLWLAIYGSPLGGTGTNYMGPAVHPGEVDQDAFLRALLALCRQRRIAHVELSNDWLDPALMERHGFTTHRQVTHVVPLPRDEDAAWKQLRGTCRNRIRKAMNNDLVVEVVEDPAIVDHFYDQFTEVYAKQGMATPFGPERPRSLFETLAPAGRIFPVWVKKDDEVIATGLFPYDERAVYFWGAASWLHAQRLCPNELLHWSTMKLAIARGIPAYNMCGGTSRFKDKFGGSDVPYNTFSKSLFPLLKPARRIYRRMHFARLKLLGKLRRPGRVQSQD